MERVTKIYNNPTYQYWLKKIAECEGNRIYCRHTLEHFLDVGRIAYIKALEAQISVSKELLYAAALLHDIGKAMQYNQSIPHQMASKELADRILAEEGFSEEEIKQIGTLILNHRHPEDNASRLEQIFYEADKESRLCFACQAADSCHWSMEKKNMQIRV